MLAPLIATKLHIPAMRPHSVARPHLLHRLNTGLLRKLTLLSAPAGFGKTTLICQWAAGSGRPLAWLSLDAQDGDPARFLTYLVAALQTVAPAVGQTVRAALQLPQPPLDWLLATLLNDLSAHTTPLILVLDDYHAVDAEAVDRALAFLLDHLPAHLHLVIATREDPPLPLAALRAGGQLSELRAADLRFTPAEAAEFLNDVMGLTLPPASMEALERKTEGWIAGLQLAALSLHGRADGDAFVASFSGSHRYILDYLVEEVLERQPPAVRRFLLRSALLERFCAPLCDALSPTIGGSAEQIADLERSNLFIIPLDDERRWYRYHHLFGDLLRQRLSLSDALPAGGVAELHRRASTWLEANRLMLEAFQHAAAANDIERAERLIEGDNIPRHFRGAVTTIIDWLAGLPPETLQARPTLLWRHAALLLVDGQTTGVAEKLAAAESALGPAALAAAENAPHDDATRILIGRIAAARATLALTRFDAPVMLAQSERALAYLWPPNHTLRANALWTLGLAHLFLGERAAARQALQSAVALSGQIGDPFTMILATIGLGRVEEADNELHRAAATYERVLALAGERPMQIIFEPQLGMARVLYEWNELARAEAHARTSVKLARQYEHVIDRYVVCELFLARLRLAQGDMAGASALLAAAEASARRHNFVHCLPEVAAMQVALLLAQGQPDAAAPYAAGHPLPLLRARVALARGESAAALALLTPYHAQVSARALPDEQLKALILLALAWQAQGDSAQALQHMAQALALAEPGGFVRSFVDEGVPMVALLEAAATEGVRPAYVHRLLAACAAASPALAAPPRAEPLTERERAILELIAAGRSNAEIAAQLHLSLDTVKGYNQKIFAKLDVRRRTEAVARARALNLL